MPHTTHHIDRPLLVTTLVLVFVGFFIFCSASLGLLARDGAQFSSVAVSQLVFGIGGGLLALFTLAHIPYRLFRRWSPHFFAFALFLTTLVFVPVLGYGANGARRWLNIFGMSFQPSELLKISFVLFLAWYFSTYYRRLDDVRFALGGMCAGLFIAGLPLLLQPDTGTFLILAVCGIAMTVTAGVRIRHLAMLALVLCAGFFIMVMVRPYLLDRVMTFMHPSSDPSGSGYQIKQSLIAIGSGGLFGRGFGQSVQKFSYLPEPISDSIFSVAAEEFGFFGCLVLLGLFVFFAFRCLIVATRTTDRYGGLVVVGIAILIVSQSFMNIGSMLGLMPLTGEPLAFVSHGGTSLFFTLASVGIILNISRYNKMPLGTIQLP